MNVHVYVAVNKYNKSSHWIIRHPMHIVITPRTYITYIFQNITLPFIPIHSLDSFLTLCC